MRVLWTPIADADREQQLEYIASYNTQAADWIGDEIYSQVQLLGQNPYLGRAGRIAGTREWPVVRTRFIVVYRVTDVVTILRLFHGAQDWQNTPLDT